MLNKKLAAQLKISSVQQVFNYLFMPAFFRESSRTISRRLFIYSLKLHSLVP